ncbi:hypothetical protein UFOVP1457_5 [uncultured Caudovirales phage]|uniref:Uncharacterized protein n=1 Tax=uncultured Caudovirales phage TaxID=2100421 RepID=A0A6J5SID3_9CAUD|nr:hypothetical protein UFOVP1457_5 [uncultured Caudovirales phage]
MLKMKLGKTIYVANDDRAGLVMAHHVKCTGKHRRVKSKGAEKRDYPIYSAAWSTADYVRAYESINAKRKILPWDWLQLRADPCLAPVGEDSYSEAAENE